MQGLEVGDPNPVQGPATGWRIEGLSPDEEEFIFVWTRCVDGSHFTVPEPSQTSFQSMALLTLGLLALAALARRQFPAEK